MTDNGLTLVVVDGSSGGWTVTLADNSFAAISDPVFRGATRVDYSDTYLLFNVPNTPQFQSSDSLTVTPFDPLWFANKEAVSDLLVTLVVAKRELWLLGQKTTEVWYNSGAPDFPWATQPNVLIPHGCAAKYSAAEADNAVLFLSRNRQGQGIVVEGQGYDVTRISTYAMEAEIATYERIDDAIGMAYQYNGHNFYHLTFPHENKTWLYDKTTKLWSELCWLDANGREHRHRANCCAAARGLIVMGDYQNGTLYALDPGVYTDVGLPIKRYRAYPHLLADGKRVSYRQCIVDMETGTGGNQLPAPPQVSLSWSDDRGHTFGSPVLTDGGATGEYLRSLQWRRLGMARDRVFAVSWSTPYKTAIQGAWIDAHPADS